MHYKHFIKKYKGNMVNSRPRYTTFREIDKNPDDLFSGPKYVFVRPVDDEKDFAGIVLLSDQLRNWRREIMCNPDEVIDLPIMIHSAYNLEVEWRVWIANGKAITGSQYRVYGHLSTSMTVPQKVMEFAEHMASIWNPAPMYVIDICLTANKLYIVELGCFNSAGFYQADIPNIVEHASAIAEEEFNRTESFNTKNSGRIT